MATEWKVYRVVGAEELERRLNESEPNPDDDWSIDKIIPTRQATNTSEAEFVIVMYRTRGEEVS